MDIEAGQLLYLDIVAGQLLYLDIVAGPLLYLDIVAAQLLYLDIVAGQLLYVLAPAGAPVSSWKELVSVDAFQQTLQYPGARRIHTGYDPTTE